MRCQTLALSFCLSFGPLWLTAQTEAKPVRPQIQVALLLDTSNSMDGLINQAKSQLWTFVNRFAPLRRDGQSPELQVALYEYGKSSIPAGEGYMRQVLPFTTDLDKVSEQLFALTTQGGEEYCGMVIRAATQGLAWSSSPRDLKVIFIAGNEPFTQGSVDYRTSCNLARTKDISVNTIFCGAYQEGASSNWADGAKLGGGSYMSIDQERHGVHLSAPQDTEIERLGVELNSTYIPIGVEGARSAMNQATQDTNATKSGAGSMNQRAQAKASSFYRADAWDLVDAEKAGKKKLESMDKKELPIELQKMTPAEARSYVDGKAKARSEIQAKIRTLSAEREKYLLEKRKESTKGGVKTLDSAMSEALDILTRAKGFVSK